jgi:hypothetical protein
MSVFEDKTLNKWCWIELTGFDNEKADFGVPDFLGRAGFIPDGISLLLYWTGFVISHQSLDREKPLAACEASYGGHEYSPERRRQDWTNLQLRALIDILHINGIKVYLSYFNMYSYWDDRDGARICEYFKDKEYLMETSRGGSRGALSMLKRTGDDEWFEDILQEKTVAVLCDYGFDGIQIADGISSPRISLQEGDYTSDMLEQCGIAVPPDETDAAGYIWRERRLEWIKFHTGRWETFYKKYTRRLREAGKEAIFNSAWTRDPFEAMYRYGVDYRSVAAAGIGGCMVEDVSPSLAILSSRDNGYLMTDRQRRRVHYEFLAALMLNRAAMPNLRITPLSSVHDTMEQWGVLEHMPTSMTRNVLSNLNSYIVTSGGLRQVTDGPYFCLSDGLSASDWSFIKGNWETGFTSSPMSTAGAALVWSDSRLDNELARFCSDRRLPTHRLFSELLYSGAPVNTIVRTDMLDYAKGPLLVTNFDLLDGDERNKILGYKNGAVLAIGQSAAPDIRFHEIARENNPFGHISLWLLDGKGRELTVIDNDKTYDFDPCLSMEKVGMLWTHPLDFAPVSDQFMRLCGDLIIEITGAPRIVSEPERRVCKYICIHTGPDTCKVILTNDDYYYNHPAIDLGREIKEIRCLTKYYGFKVSHSGRRFECRVPGRGAEAFEVVFEPAY